MNKRQQARRELLPACRAGYVARILQLVTTTPIQATDASEALDSAIHRVEVLRCLLDRGADPNSCTRTRVFRSLDIVKLFVEYGYNLSATGHLILQ